MNKLKGYGYYFNLEVADKKDLSKWISFEHYVDIEFFLKDVVDIFSTLKNLSWAIDCERYSTEVEWIFKKGDKSIFFYLSPTFKQDLCSDFLNLLNI